MMEQRSSFTKITLHGFSPIAVPVRMVMWRAVSVDTATVSGGSTSDFSPNAMTSKIDAIILSARPVTFAPS